MAMDMDMTASSQVDALKDQLTRDVQHELKREMADYRHELDQIRSLLQDATAKLTVGFQGLQEQSNRQGSLVLALISSSRTDESVQTGQERIDLKRFVAETDQVLRTFVDHILQVSQQSMKMVYRVNDLADKMAKVVKVVDRIRSVAEQTNVLALNARIVAARAGEHGKAFNVVADEVRKLSRDARDASSQIDEMVTSSQEDIQWAQEIIGTMASQDMSFALTAKGRMDSMTQQINELDRFTTATLGEISEITCAINQNVELAIISLQFEDLIMQLLRNMEGKFILSEELMTSLCACFDPNQASENMAQRIGEMRTYLEAQTRRFDDASKASVQTASLDEGDVEFF